MHVIPVEFLYPVPLVEPVFLELLGVRTLLPLIRNGDGWSTTVKMAEGVYLYRFSVGKSVCVGDARRTTQRVANGEIWSVVHVVEEGPVWIDRPYPTLKSVEICQGINEVGMPMVVLNRLTPANVPFVLWIEANRLYQNASLQVFLLRPDGATVFGGQFWLEVTNAAADFSIRFWLAIDFEPGHLIPGDWTFLVKVEGAPVQRKCISLETVQA